MLDGLGISGIGSELGVFNLLLFALLLVGLRYIVPRMMARPGKTDDCLRQLERIKGLEEAQKKDKETLDFVREKGKEAITRLEEQMKKAEAEILRLRNKTGA